VLPSYDRGNGSKKRSKIAPVALAWTNLSRTSTTMSWVDHFDGWYRPSAVFRSTSAALLRWSIGRQG